MKPCFFCPKSTRECTTRPCTRCTEAGLYCVEAPVVEKPKVKTIKQICKDYTSSVLPCQHQLTYPILTTPLPEEEEVDSNEETEFTCPSNESLDAIHSFTSHYFDNVQCPLGNGSTQGLHSVFNGDALIALGLLLQEMAE